MSTDPTHSAPNYIVQPLRNQGRAVFHSGDKALDSYLLERAARDVREKLAAVFVLLTEEDKNAILGYYTLSNQEIDAGELPPALTRKTGKYRRLPATLIGRLAVSESLRGRRLGEYLLMDALRRALDATANIYVICGRSRCQRRACRRLLREVRIPPPFGRQAVSSNEDD